MSHDDFAFEPIRGLPQRLPQGEHILWQGRPDAWALAWEALSLPLVAAYFGALALWRFATVLDTDGLAKAVAAASAYVLMGAVVGGLLWLVAYVQARATVYTITNARVTMRIGAALTLTLNLPFAQIATAELDLRRRGTGTIALGTLGETRLSYLVCWPHVRPWRMKRPQPALRCIPDALRVARLLAEAAEARTVTPRLARDPLPARVMAAE
jgi:hypothetical protein